MDPMCNAPTPDSYVSAIQQENNDREQFVRQLEILCETNRRLGESNDELRQALGVRNQFVFSVLYFQISKTIDQDLKVYFSLKIRKGYFNPQFSETFGGVFKSQLKQPR